VKKIFKLKTFWISILIVSGIIFLALNNLNRGYQTETDILIIPKNSLIAGNISQIIENLSQIPLTLSFYKRVNQENGDVFDDTILELPDYKKQIYWKSRLKIIHIKGSGILKIITFGNNSYQAELLNQEVVRTFLVSISSYYNIKTELDLRIINQFITNFTNQSNFSILFFESLLGGFILSSLIFGASFYFFQKELFLKTVPTKPFFDYSKFNYQLKNNQKNNSWLKESFSDMNLSKKQSTASIIKEKTSQAPSNLPLAPVSFSKDTANKKISVEVKKPKKTEITREATPEEVKAKLNSLLKGE